ncbi:hypothetical protein BVC80_93g2 [Macleaya cordata]|uniref:Transposase MuDR plant domain-containing protein n=1 Tax=Macleaya cordata TaxID=56857 RepID=A0A200Q6P3_MACCD|nr:hypothetical protein BVC80_93g2 [Macleaya cordata]
MRKKSTPKKGKKCTMVVPCEDKVVIELPEDDLDSDYDCDPQADVDIDAESAESVESDIEEGKLPPPSKEFDGVVVATDNLYDDSECNVQGEEEMSYDKLVVGMQWKNVFEYRRYLRRFAVKQWFEIKYIKNDLVRIRGRCASKGCPWFIFASKIRGELTFRLNTLVEGYTRLRHVKKKNKMVTYKSIAEELEDCIRGHKKKNYKPSLIVEDFWQEFMVDISYWVAWRVKGVALERIYSSYDESYKLSPEICRQLILANPGTVTSVSKDDVTKVFDGICIAL